MARKADLNEVDLLPDLPVSQEMRRHFERMITALQGSLYTSSTVEDAVKVVKYLRAHPDTARVFLETK